MSDIFISYASADRERARGLAAHLEHLGWSVWWDRDIQAGKTFAGVIESEIDRARCVIVLWSLASVGSRWVRDEANEGLKRDVLVPVLFEAIDPPLGFRSIHAADLVGWDGDHRATGFRDLVRDLASVLGPPPAGDASPQRVTPPAPRPTDGWRKVRPWLLSGAAALLVLGVGAAGVAYFRADLDRRVADATAEARSKADADAEKQRAERDAARRAQAEADARQRAADEAAARDAEARRRAEADAAERQAQADAARIAAAEAARDARAEAARSAEAEAARKAREDAARRAAANEAAQKKAEAERARLAADEAARRAQAERQKQAAAAARAAAAAPVLAAKVPELLPSVGDSWSYRYVDGFKRAEVARLTYRIDGITSEGLNESLAVSNQPDLASRILVTSTPEIPARSGIAFAPPDLAPYLQAFYDLAVQPGLPTVARRITSDSTVDLRMRIVGTEAVTVPAGRFDAIKVEAEGRGYSLFKRLPVHSIVTIWYARSVKRFVKYTVLSFEQSLPQELSTFELVEYRVKP